MEEKTCDAERQDDRGALLDAKAVVATARDAEQVASKSAAQEVKRRQGVEKQLAELQQAMQQVRLLLLSMCALCGLENRLKCFKSCTCHEL